MPYYRRWRKEGGVYFFTLVTLHRRPILVDDAARTMLREALREAQSRLPFELPGIVLLPDHLHMLMRLPEGDADFPRRVAKIKRNFTERYLSAGGSESPVSPAKRSQRYRGIWQARYYEHCIRGYADFTLHLDYVHINPVKHGLVQRPRDWAWSTFNRYVEQGEYDPDWCGHVTLAGGTDIEPDEW